jgi:O-antigen/teichoic acid export membrane protein
MATSTVQQAPQRRERFVKNVLWNWFGVSINILTGLVLPAYIIRKLGDEGYGIWTIIFAFVDYYWLMDLGFRSATFKYTAHYRALNEPDNINEVINTGVIYSSGVAVLMMIATLLLAPYTLHFFPIAPAYHRTFVTLVMLVGAGWAMGAIFNLFSASVEAFQRFDISNRIWVTTIAVRSAGMVAVLATGHGLVAMANVTLVSLGCGYLLNYLCMRRIFPEMRLSIKLARFTMFKRMLRYGIHTFQASLSMQLLNQSGTIMVAHFLPSAFAGYFAYPWRLMNYSVDIVNRVGLVAGSNAAEMAAKGDMEPIARMGLLVNRYCFVMFAPLALASGLYGTELFRVWIKPAFAIYSAPLLPVLAVGITLGIAAQFNSSSILYGLGKHQNYAYSLMVEGLLNLAGMYYAVPRFGILGAAWVSAILMIVNRGLVTSYLFSHATGFNFWAYLRGIYLGPLAAAAISMAIGWWIKMSFLPGKNWFQVLAGSALMTLLFYTICFFTCLEKQHRSVPVKWIQKRFGSATA